MTPLRRSGPIHIGDLTPLVLAQIWERICKYRRKTGRPLPPEHLNPNHTNQRGPYMGTRFTPEDVLGLAVSSDGGLDDGMNAYVSAGIYGDHAEVELTSTEEDEADRVTERFRVTVERIEDGQ